MVVLHRLQEANRAMVHLHRARFTQTKDIPMARKASSNPMALRPVHLWTQLAHRTTRDRPRLHRHAQVLAQGSPHRTPRRLLLQR